MKTAYRRHHEQGKRNLDDAVALLPTPRATDGEKGGPNQRGSSGDLMLTSAVMLLPTPTASRYGNNQSPSPGATVRHGLDSIDKLLPTPTVTDAKGGRNATAGRSNPESKHHSGQTLTDVFWTGLDTPPQSNAGADSSDDLLPPRLF